MITTMEYTSIKDIFLRFHKHSKTKRYPTEHTVLDRTYGTYLPDLDALFEDGDKRTKVQPNAIQVLRTQIVGHIQEVATATTDKPRIPTLLEGLPLSAHLVSSDSYIGVRTTKDLERLLDEAVCAPSKTVNLYLTIDSLHFRYEFNPLSFDDISTFPFVGSKKGQGAAFPFAFAPPSQSPAPSMGGGGPAPMGAASSMAPMTGDNTASASNDGVIVNNINTYTYYYGDHKVPSHSEEVVEN